MSTDNDKLIIRTAIDVNIDNIKAAAFLDESCSFNSIHETVVKRICEDDSQTYDDGKNKTIELQTVVDDRSISAIFRVVTDLWADMIIGKEFSVFVKANDHRELKLSRCCVSNEAKSSKKEEIGSTVSQDPSSKEKKKRKRNKKSKKSNDTNPSGSTDLQSSGDSYRNETNSSEKEEIESIASQEPSTADKKKSKRTRRNKSKKNNDPSSGSTDSQLSDGNGASNEKKSLKKEEIESTESQEDQKKRRRKRPKKKKSKNSVPSNALAIINFYVPPLTFVECDSAKMFIVERELWDILSGEILLYVGVYVPQFDLSIIRSEVIIPWEKRPVELHMAILHVAFNETKKRGVVNLHVLSENEDCITLMDRRKKYGRSAFKGRNRAVFFDKIYAAFYDVSKFKSIKFEYVAECDVDEHNEMVHAKKLVDKFIENNRYNSI